MHLDMNDTVHHNMTEQSITSYKLYNLLFSGKITIQEYLQGLKTLQGNQKES